MKRLLLAFCVTLASAAPLEAQADSAAMSGEARAYLAAALDSIQAVSLRRETTNWQLVRDSAYLLAAGAQRPAHTYGAINWALQKVDSHSFLQAAFPRINPELIRGRVGYFRIPFHSAGSKVVLADTLQNALRDLEARGACGWIVDLRMNGGGNVWPMYAGVGPLFSDSILNAARVNGRLVPSALYSAGRAIGFNENGQRVALDSASNPVVLRRPDAPVAVLIDRATASSAEAIALAFRTRPHTRLFGSPSAGLTTSNRGVRLRDGANMVVTVDGMTDRNGREYTGPIEPDQPVAMPPGFWPSPVDGVARQATAWLIGQPACR